MNRKSLLFLVSSAAAGIALLIIILTVYINTKQRYGGCLLYHNCTYLPFVPCIGWGCSNQTITMYSVYVNGSLFCNTRFTWEPTNNTDCYYSGLYGIGSQICPNDQHCTSPARQFGLIAYNFILLPMLLLFTLVTAVSIIACYSKRNEYAVL